MLSLAHIQDVRVFKHQEGCSVRYTFLNPVFVRTLGVNLGTGLEVAFRWVESKEDFQSAFLKPDLVLGELLKGLGVELANAACYNSILSLHISLSENLNGILNREDNTLCLSVAVQTSDFGEGKVFRTSIRPRKDFPSNRNALSKYRHYIIDEAVKLCQEIFKKSSS